MAMWSIKKSLLMFVMCFFTGVSLWSMEPVALDPASTYLSDAFAVCNRLIDEACQWDCDTRLIAQFKAQIDACDMSLKRQAQPAESDYSFVAAWLRDIENGLRDAIEDAKEVACDSEAAFACGPEGDGKYYDDIAKRARRVEKQRFYKRLPRQKRLPNT